MPVVLINLNVFLLAGKEHIFTSPLCRLIKSAPP